METQFDELMTVSEIAALLKVPVSWVYARTRRPGIEKIPHVKLGNYLRFSVDGSARQEVGFMRGHKS